MISVGKLVIEPLRKEGKMEIIDFMIPRLIGMILGLTIGWIIIRKLQKRSERKWQDWMKENDVIEIE